MKKLILLALNEFNVDFFRKATEVTELPNITWMLDLQHSQTWTDDKIERKGLDPWVQWVSIHTGSPSTTHGIRHLGDVPNLSTPQIWEILSAREISSGIWGAMNASRNDAEFCQFFLPDPWTYSEVAYPDQLNKLLALPRYYSRNYLEPGKIELVRSLGKFLAFVLCKPAIFLETLKLVPFSLRGLRKFGISNHLLFSVFDLINTAAFLHYKKKYNPDFTLLFLNSIAHMQHNIWCETGTLDEACEYSLQAIDRALGMLREAAEPNESIVVMNALNQRNIATEKEELLYRQINPARFLSEIGVNYLSVEQLMTNDAHIIFNSPAEALAARDMLASATINTKVAFDVEYTENSANKLFCQLDFWDPLPGDAVMVIGGRSFRFFDHFEQVVRRTGEHLQSGDAYSFGLDLPQKLFNHEVQHFILHYFGIDAAGAKPSASNQVEPAMQQ